MTDSSVITFAPFVFKRDDFFVIALLYNFSGHFRAGDQRIAMSDVLAVG